jgi:hypothetical protein
MDRANFIAILADILLMVCPLMAYKEEMKRYELDYFNYRRAV